MCSNIDSESSRAVARRTTRCSRRPPSRFFDLDQARARLNVSVRRLRLTQSFDTSKEIYEYKIEAIITFTPLGFILVARSRLHELLDIS